MNVGLFEMVRESLVLEQHQYIGTSEINVKLKITFE